MIATCLKKDPDQRFQNALDLKLALESAIEQGPSVASPEGSKLWMWLRAAAALIIGAPGVWTFIHLRQPPSEDRALRLRIEAPEGGQF